MNYFCESTEKRPRWLHFCLYHPVSSAMGALLLVFLGSMALMRIPLDLLPSLETPRLSIYTAYPQASPPVVEQNVTKPLEDALAGIPGMRSLRSSSSEGSSYIVAEFRWGARGAELLEEVRDRIGREESRLPPEASRPLVRQFDSQAVPVMMLSFATPMDPFHARNFARSRLVPPLERLEGVASVLLWGGGLREIRVTLDPFRMKSLKISPSQVRRALEEANFSSPGGHMLRGSREFLFRTAREFASLEEIRQTPLRIGENRVVPLCEVAEVAMVPQNPSYIYRVNRRPSVQMVIYKKAGENTVALADRVSRVLEKFNRAPSFPGEMVVLFDSSRYIRESLGNLFKSAFFGGILGLGVFLLFFPGVLFALVAAAGVLGSLGLCFLVMYLGEISFNIMSLGGLTLGLGMLVDNTIVVLESIRCRRKEGFSPLRAALEGTRCVAVPLFGGTLTTAIVFLPLFFSQGVTGVLFRELGVVVGASLFASLGMSLTLVPVLSRYLSFGDFSGKNGGFSDCFGRKYLGILLGIFRRPGLPWGVSLFFVLLAAGVFPLLEREFASSTDESELRISFSMVRGTSLEVRETMLRTLEDLVTEHVPEAEAVQSAADAEGNSGILRVRLCPPEKRDRRVQEIAGELSRRLKMIPGIQGGVRVRNSVLGRLLGGTGEESLSLEIRGPSSEVARAIEKDVLEAVRRIPGITHAQGQGVRRIPEYALQISRARIAAMEVSQVDVARGVHFLLAGEEAGEFRRGEERYPLRLVGVPPGEITLPELLEQNLPLSGGKNLSLKNMVREDRAQAPPGLHRKDRQRSRTVTMAAPGKPLPDLIRELRLQLQALPLPRGYVLIPGGALEERNRSFGEMYRSIVLAAVLVFMVLACQFEAFAEPLMVMGALPFALGSAVLLLFLTDTPWDLYAILGCLLLTGMVVNHGLLLFYQARKNASPGSLFFLRGIAQAGRERLRPAFISTITTGAALFPLALGMGGTMQAPLARAVLGGIAGALGATLLILPQLYSAFRRCAFFRKMP